MSGLLDAGIAPLLVGVIAALLFAVRAQLLATRARGELHALQHERVDPSTRLLPQTAIPLRLEPELQWAEHEGKPMGVVVFKLRGNHPERAARALRVAMRGEENAYLLGGDRFLCGLWDTSEEGVLIGVQRLGDAMRRAGRELVDAGVAMFPRDGRELEELVELAEGDMRPLDQQLPASMEPVARRSVVARGMQTLARVAPGVGLAAVPLALSYWLLQPLARPDALALGGLLLAPLAAGAFALNWLRGAPGEPRSAGTDVPAWPLALGALAAGTVAMAPAALGGSGELTYLGAVTFHMWLALLVVAEGRYLVRVETSLLCALLAVAGLLTWFTYEDLPLLANAGRLVAAMAVGAVIARAIERVWWVVPVAAAIALVDVWSVFSSSGTTKNLLESDSGGAEATLGLLLFVGAPVAQPLYEIGTTDFVFAAAFLCVAHSWRLPMLRTLVALVLGVLGAFLVVLVLEEAVPVLPFMSLAVLLAHGPYLLDEVRDAIRPSGREASAGAQPLRGKQPA